MLFVKQEKIHFALCGSNEKFLQKLAAAALPLRLCPNQNHCTEGLEVSDVDYCGLMHEGRGGEGGAYVLFTQVHQVACMCV